MTVAELIEQLQAMPYQGAEVVASAEEPQSGQYEPLRWLAFRSPTVAEVRWTMGPQTGGATAPGRVLLRLEGKERKWVDMHVQGG